VRITSRIVDVTSGEAIADAKVDGAFDDIFNLQDEVVRQLSREMALPDRTWSSRDTTSLKAFQAFTEGWLALESLEVDRMAEAVGKFEHAVAADPRYARAYAGLASAELACFESTRADNEPQQQLLARAVSHAREAVALDAALAEAHATLAMLLVSAGETEAAGIAGRRAVTIEPANWRHWFRLGHASWGSERVRAAAHTQSLYPEFAFSHFQVAMVHVARRALTDAETVLRQGAAVQDRQIARGGRYPALGLHWLLGLVRLSLGDVDEALEEFSRGRRSPKLAACTAASSSCTPGRHGRRR
jgi:tetratricopeptide (TPR) repeat protein